MDIKPCSLLNVNRLSEKNAFRIQTFNEVHGIVSQKMEVFVCTGVRTSDPTRRSLFSEKLYTCISGVLKIEHVRFMHPKSNW